MARNPWNCYSDDYTQRKRMEMTALNRMVQSILGLLKSDSYSDAKLNAWVDGYLVGTGDITTRRRELADAFWKAAPLTDMSERVRRKILKL